MKMVSISSYKLTIEHTTISPNWDTSGVLNGKSCTESKQ